MSNIQDSPMQPVAWSILRQLAYNKVLPESQLGSFWQKPGRCRQAHDYQQNPIILLASTFCFDAGAGQSTQQRCCAQMSPGSVQQRVRSVPEGGLACSPHGSLGVPPQGCHHRCPHPLPSPASPILASSCPQQHTHPHKPQHCHHAHVSICNRQPEH